MGLSKYDIEIDLENRQGTSHAFLVEMVGANKRVLDVGCDTGYLGEALNALGNETVGFEANPTTAEVARTRSPGSRLATSRRRTSSPCSDGAHSTWSSSAICSNICEIPGRRCARLARYSRRGAAC
jgi:ribosomal protein L11 methylase PrmA